MSVYNLVNSVLYLLSKAVPKKNRWVFGSWFGKSASDNPKAIYDYMNTEKFSDIEKVWILRDTASADIKGCKVLKRNSMKGIYYVLTAKVAIVNQGFEDLCTFNILGGCYKVQLWHGIAWKKIALDAKEDAITIRQKAERILFQYSNHYDLYIAPSRKWMKILISAFATDEKHIEYVGQPRNTPLFSVEECNNKKKILLKLLGVCGEKQVIIYLPTFRDTTKEVFSFCNSNISKEISRICDIHNCVLVEKSHFASEVTRKSEYKNIFPVTDVDAGLLLGAADLLITDYSSCFFDFLIKNKPIIYYLYDYAYYRDKDRGLYYPIEDVAAGTVVFSEEDMMMAIVKNLENPDLYENERNHLRQLFLTFENRGNCKKIVSRIRKDVGV